MIRGCSVSRLSSITLNSTPCLWTRLKPTRRKSFTNFKLITIYIYLAWIELAFNSFSVQFLDGLKSLMALFIRALYWLWFQQMELTHHSSYQCNAGAGYKRYITSFEIGTCKQKSWEYGLSLVTLQYIVGGFQQTYPQMDPISVLQCYTVTCSWGNLRRLTCKQVRKMGHTISTRDHATTLKGKDWESSFWFRIIID